MVRLKPSIKLFLVVFVVAVIICAALAVAYLYMMQSKPKQNEEPVAAIFADKRTASVNETIQFSAKDSFDNDGKIARYYWNFGDGSLPGVSMDMSHEYAGPGEYTVVLTVYDDDDAQAQATMQITVTSNHVPVAIFSPDKYEYSKNEMATFDASGSFDPDGTIVHFYWEFGDGTTATGNLTKHAFASSGNFSIRLTVTDDKNSKGTTVRNIMVHSNQAPIAVANASSTRVYAGEQIEFSSTGSLDPDGSISSYIWNFGDGTSGEGLAIVHSFSLAGNFTVSLTVTDSAGAASSAFVSITVLDNAAPVAVLTSSGALFDTGQFIPFSGLGSYDSEGPIASYKWSFGDGVEGTGMNVTHMYSTVGMFDVTLTVADEKGLTSTATKHIGIKRPPTPSVPYTTLPFEIASQNASDWADMQIRLEGVPVVDNSSYALGYGLDPSAFVTFRVGFGGASLLIYCERYAMRPLWLNLSELVDVQGVLISYSGTWEIKVRADTLDYAWKVGETPTTYPPTYAPVTITQLLANNQTYKNQRVVVYDAVVTDSNLYPIYGANLSHYVKFNVSEDLSSVELMIFANTTHRPTALENYDRVNIWGTFTTYYGDWQIKVTDRYDKIERVGTDSPPTIDSVERNPYNVRPTQQVNITAHVIDDNRVSIVYLNYSVNGGTCVRAQMVPYSVDSSGNGQYKYTIPGQMENAVVRYFVQTFDNASQEGLYPEGAPTITYSYTVATDSPPSFVSVAREPYSVYANQQAVVTAKVSDDQRITSVQLSYSFNNGTYVTITMTALNVDAQMCGDYTGAIPGQSAGTYVKYYLRATDDASHTTYNPAGAPSSVFSYSVLSGVVNNIYIANLHSHTALSDGQGTPSEAYAYARDTANIDVLGITDHTSYLTSTEWTSLKNAASTYTSSGTFVALYGQEFGSLNDFGHSNIWECPTLCPESTSNLAGFYSWVDSQNAIAGYNHPSPSYGTNFNNFQYYSADADNMCTFEVFNGKRTSSYETQYISALDKGWLVGAVSNQDNHEKLWGTQASDDGRVYLTGIHAPALTKSDILAAIRARHVYAMTVSTSTPDDRILLWFSANDQQMGSTISPGTITLRAKVSAQTNFQKLSIYNGYTHSWSYKYISTNSYEWVMSVNAVAGGYFFLRAEQADGDYAYSSPIRVASSKGLNNSIETEPQTEYSESHIEPPAEPVEPRSTAFLAREMRAEVCLKAGRGEW